MVVIIETTWNKLCLKISSRLFESAKTRSADNYKERATINVNKIIKDE